MIVKGMEVLLDKEDEERFSVYKYGLQEDENRLYAYRRVRENKKEVKYMLHREIMGCQKNDGKIVDHKNGNTLDNRKCNLRVCTIAENVRNQKKNKLNTSGYKGVDWVKRDNRWRAKIKLNKKIIYLGYYIDILDAAKAYAEASKKYHGEFGRVK